ncbi:hypothetical protein PsorP6_010607 [Peronosclerospora sorghi]|uniref:Uncharacterized protein n=1 Tax=Peronosclerospora sorghi TaxID=230839 RepID=A0ACC0VUL2_9STRA|nr:hypothetical protein PsorP6_010607 [Peronosclerospora sorghi]
MLKRMVKLKPALLILGLNGDIQLPLSSLDWRIIELSIKLVLEVFARAERFMVAEKRVTISLVPTALRSIRHSIGDAIAKLTTTTTAATSEEQGDSSAEGDEERRASQIVLEGIQMLFEDFEQRWGENKQDLSKLSDTIALAEALDPQQRAMDLLQKDMPALAGEERPNDADQEKERVANKNGKRRRRENDVASSDSKRRKIKKEQRKSQKEIESALDMDLIWKAAESE